MECLRDIDLEEMFMRTGTPEADLARNLRWGDTFTGEEFVRSMAFGSDPHRQGDYWEASPCKYLDIPQNEAEPLLLRYATHRGWQVRFNTEFVSFQDDSEKGFVTTLLRDTVTRQDLRVKSKYLAGADGGRSKVAEQLELPFVDKGSYGLALNIHFKADLSEHVKHRVGLIHGSLVPYAERPPWGVAGILRAIKPWNEWLTVVMAAPGVDKIEASEEEILKRNAEFIGFQPPDFQLLGISQWNINEQYAESLLSKGRVFCLGDAIHRHPPQGGLGSNTAVQDAYNLAWKLAYVLRGQAAPALLASYTRERQPVAAQVVTHANDMLRTDLEIWRILGALEPTVAARTAALAELRTGTSPAARARRRALVAAQHAARIEHQGLGSEFNQRYAGCGAVCTAGEPPRTAAAPPARDPKLFYAESTAPGHRLPHAWLSPDRKSRVLSTQDVAGRGAFALLTGVGGRAKWAGAAARAAAGLARRTGGGAPPVSISVTGIGMGQELEDLYWMWERKREVEETGAVLVRPDRVVGWRCHEADEAGEEELGEKLEQALAVILGFEADAEELPVR